MKDWNKTVDKKIVEEVISNLEPRGIEVFLVDTSSQAKKKVLELVPQKSRVLAASSQTLQQIGLTEEFSDSEKYTSIRKEYMGLDHKKDADKIRVIRSTPDYIVGSVNAITKKGEAIIASNTGSQITAYVGGAKKVIWVIGTQKIVDNLDEGFKRIYEFVLPLESERLKKLYGIPSSVNKLLIFDKEVVPGRVTIIFVNESLGY